MARCAVTTKFRFRSTASRRAKRSSSPTRPTTRSGRSVPLCWDNRMASETRNLALGSFDPILRAQPSDDMADQERNRLTARAARYARVGRNVGGVAARMAGARFLGIDIDR